MFAFILAFSKTVIFSFGEEPYHKIVEPIEVQRHIKTGKTVEKPEYCSQEMFDKLILPCFESNPADRPGFIELHDLAIDLGGIDEAHDLNQDVDHHRSTAASMAATFVGQERLRLLGPSVHHFLQRWQTN